MHKRRKPMRKSKSRATKRRTAKRSATSARRSDHELHIDPRNANLGTERGRALLETSLREYGAGRAVLADRDGVLIAGNKTFEMARRLGIPTRLVETDGRELVVVRRQDLRPVLRSTCPGARDRRQPCRGTRSCLGSGNSRSVEGGRSRARHLLDGRRICGAAWGAALHGSDGRERGYRTARDGHRTWRSIYPRPPSGPVRRCHRCRRHGTPACGAYSRPARHGPAVRRRL